MFPTLLHDGKDYWTFSHSIMNLCSSPGKWLEVITERSLSLSDKQPYRSTWKEAC